MKFRLITTFYCLVLSSSLSIAQDPANYSLMELDSVIQNLKKVEAYEEIFPFAREFVRKSKSKYGKTDTLYAQAIYELGIVYDYGKGDEEKALELYQEAIEIHKKKPLPSEVYAQSLFAAGDIFYFGQEKYREALDLYTQGLQIREIIWGRESPIYSESLNLIAVMLHDMGNYSIAEKYYTQNVRVRKKIYGPKHEKYFTALLNIGELYYDIGLYEEIEPICLEVLSNCVEKSDNYTSALDLLARVYLEFERYVEAEKLLLEQLELEKEIAGEYDSWYAMDLNKLGVFYWRTRQYKKAEEAYKQALAIRKELKDIDGGLDYVESLQNLAVLYQDMKLFSKAKNTYNEVLLLLEKLLSKNHPKYANALRTFGYFNIEINNYEAAKKCYEEAIEIKEINGDTLHSQFLVFMNDLAYVYLKLKDWDKASFYTKRAINLNCKERTKLEFNLDKLTQMTNHTFFYYNELFTSLKRVIEILNAKDSSKSAHQFLLKKSEILQIVLELSRQQRHFFSSTNDQ